MWNLEFPWSDNWWIEQNKAWFCAGEIGALFCVDMDTEQCQLVSRIPECEMINFRQYSYCMKDKNEVFCLPNIAKCIWCYNLDTLQWKKIDVGNEQQLFICRSFYRKNMGKIYFWHEEGNVLEINIVKRVLEKRYSIPKEKDEEIGEYVLIDNKLYCVLGKYVYCINVDNGEITSYMISAARAGLYTICFDGDNFWLSGFGKEIYIWNPQRGVVKVITEFPEQFGIYNFHGSQTLLVDCTSFITTEYPFFHSSVSLGKYVWFIPCQTNEIMYIDKETYEILTLDIERESETQESLKMSRLACRFLVEYIREERYIGLYSIKNQRVFEIDTLELCINDRDYCLSDSAMWAIIREAVKYDNQKILREYNKMERMFYSALLKENSKEKDKNLRDIGGEIYHILDK